MSICISVVTYNSNTVFECLDYLLKQNVQYKIKVFDNNSSEEFKRKLLKYSDSVELNFHNENLGFGAAHNLNLVDVTEEYVIIFNPDVKADKDVIEELKDFMDKNLDVSMVTPKILNSDGTQQYLIRNKLTLFDFFLRRQPFTILRDKIFKKRMEAFDNRYLSSNQLSEIKISSGCFMFIRNKSFEKVKGFDDRYFMYFEDYDLCNKLRDNGKIIYYPFVSITHFWERGSHKSSNLFKIFVQSMFKYFNKWGWKLF